MLWAGQQGLFTIVDALDARADRLSPDLSMSPFMSSAPRKALGSTADPEI
jgi:hypothetical protein